MVKLHICKPSYPEFDEGLCGLSNFFGGSDDKESVCNVGDPGLIPGFGRSPGAGNSYPLQYSRRENSTDRGAWRATVPNHTQASLTESCWWQDFSASQSFPSPPLCPRIQASLNGIQGGLAACGICWGCWCPAAWLFLKKQIWLKYSLSNVFAFPDC